MLIWKLFAMVHKANTNKINKNRQKKDGTHTWAQIQ